MAKVRKQLFTAFKLLFGLALIYFVFTKIPFKEVWLQIKGANFLFLGIALFLFTSSKVLAALRLNGFFRRIGVNLSEKSNLKLYWLGMFYNLFLPGGIGGDAYKGYLLNKKFGAAPKRLFGALLSDRLSGLLALLLLSCVLLLFIEQAELVKFRWMVYLLLPFGGIAYWGIHRLSFRYLIPEILPALGYSLAVQLTQLLVVVFILFAMGVDGSFVPYLLIFFLSSMAAVVPLTIGGIGSRELVFLYGSQFLGLTEHVAVGISLVFLFITALVSLAGAYFVWVKPELQEKSKELSTELNDGSL